MSQQKLKKIPTSWMSCEKCSVTILNKDAEKHFKDCPTSAININYPFIKDNVLFGTLDLKINEEIKNISSRQLDRFVFISQNAIQMCSLSLGDWSIVKLLNNKYPPVARIVWPTTEKSLTSVLFTKNGLDLTFVELNQYVQISRVSNDLNVAKSVQLVILNGPKMLEFNNELYNRISKSHNGCIVTVGNKISIMFYGKNIIFEVKSINKEYGMDLESKLKKMTIDEQKFDFFKINETTKWNLFRSEELFIKETDYINAQTGLAGVDEEINEIREIMQTYLHKKDMFPLSPIKSVLIYGNSGTGKTSIAKYLAQECNETYITILAPDLYSKNATSVEEILKEKFEEAVERAPSVIVIDEIDILCPTRSGRLSDTEKRIVSTMLLMLDDLNQQRKGRVFIIATTNKIDSIDPVFRRCGRLDREIEIPTPSPKNRRAILEKILTGSPVKSKENVLQEIAMNTHGYVGADLVSLCSTASLFAKKRQDNIITIADFRLAIKTIKPSAMRDVQVEVPNVKWSDIGGQHNLKLMLKQSVEWPLKHPNSFKRLGIDPPRGVLMFGPPGCSKTMIAKALATESGLNFLSIKGPELFSKWVGESEKAVRDVFQKARRVAPSIIFFDEIDALGSERNSGSTTSVQERVLAQLLTELDGITPLGDVTIVAASNRPDRIDKALLRPGRLDRIVYVPLPDEETRREIFQIKFSKMPVKDVDPEDLVNVTEGYSGAEVNAVCHEAAMAALEENLEIQHIEYRHFEKALKLITPRTPPSLIVLYEDYFKNKNIG